MISNATSITGHHKVCSTSRGWTCMIIGVITDTGETVVASNTTPTVGHHRVYLQLQRSLHACALLLQCVMDNREAVMTVDRK